MSEFDTGNGEGGSFLSRVDWAAFWTSLVVSFGVFFYTLAPSVTLEDGGELAVAGDWLGVPHPPGYPSWSMLAWVFARLFSFVTFRGQPNPSYGIAMLSAVSGAIASGLAAMLICRSGRDILRRSGRISHNMGAGIEHIICWTGGVSASLLFAFTPIMWSQSVIVEVYSLNALILIAVMLLVYRWMCRPSDKILFLTALIFGVGLTNYQVLLLAALSLAILIMFRDFELFRDFAVTGGPIVAVLLLMRQGVLPAIQHPTHPSMYIYLGLNGALLVLAYFLLPRGRTVAITILMAEIGVSVYAYMPIVSDLRNPPMNWGYPRTWEGFQHAVSRGQYEKIVPVDIFSIRFLHQIGTYLADLRLNFTLLVSLIAFLPFSTWRLRVKERVFDGAKMATLLIAVSLLLLPIGRFVPLYKVSALGVFLILALGAVTMIVARFRGLVRDHIMAREARLWERITAVGVLGLTALIWVALVGKKLIAVLAPLGVPGALAPGKWMEIALQLGMIPVLLVAPFLIFWLAAALLSMKDRFELTVDDASQKWMVSTLIAFVTLSLGLIALANLKMDIQDTFIQRVKFISSHLLFSFWVGYGMIFLLAFLDGRLRRRRLTWILIVAAALLPGIPILANAYNSRLIDVYGGADQHDRDFGWQFGNYQLRGAAAILEELEPDEEPLPNPVFPPEMGKEAIFFGGTDPGRFVPTYMIYSARVRPDVYLITQNALADGTYMNVMRDLYGNNIWIPSVADSANAFSQFVHEIETGQRPDVGGITREGGRVQITGVMGVMEINGILARNIFDYNNWKHDFFVEESYVIRWMYPYLTPHGQIMKINRDPLPALRTENVQDDLDFWDWYTRRFIANRWFLRDVVARKSFSKLRSAIAGLYAFRGMQNEAKQAFLEAMILYPLSPEANFRLAEVYLRTGEFDKARDLMLEFQAKDPANDRSQEFIRQIEGLKGVSVRIGEMENELKQGPMDVQKLLMLADLYRQANRSDDFMNLTARLLNTPDLPSFALLPLAQLYDQAGRPQEMSQALTQCLERIPGDVPPQVLLDIVRLFSKANQVQGMRNALQKYLDRRPNDWKAWLDLATMDIRLGHPEQAASSMGVAVRYGGADAQRAIQGNPVLAPVWQQRAVRTQGLLGL
jgi:thioredoxin-like negative regulator of GroEL